VTNRIETIEYIPVSEARSKIPTLIENAVKKSRRVALTRHNVPIAGIVPYADLETLEREDEIAFEEMDAERDMERVGEVDHLKEQALAPADVIFMRGTTASQGTAPPTGLGIAALVGAAMGRSTETSADCLPIGAESTDRNAFFLTGQIMARITDAQLGLAPVTVQAIQRIVGRTLHNTFDQTTLPNFPATLWPTPEVPAAGGIPATAHMTPPGINPWFETSAGFATPPSTGGLATSDETGPATGTPVVTPGEVTPTSPPGSDV